MKDKIPDDEKRGVYKPECQYCSGVYIGGTGRQLKIKVAEHLPAWTSFSMGYLAFANHLHGYKE